MLFVGKSMSLHVYLVMVAALNDRRIQRKTAGTQFARDLSLQVQVYLNLAQYDSHVDIEQ